ncbi:hypothetical protein FJ444_17360 [Aestuariibacter sp. GS-14]|uniref:glycoside hydrolase family 44 protein n=1 Tax=Aestuariibacter sp. GS-14 TaxID=2590670 RepID=UPI00112DCA5B|nr:glycoside hydrolase family 44 protein [Aestuariibacter sp. GS-14]TPV55465.1 hypothetical protein FJ444_17360 [Aestuariibacter sp. GS-14]
MSLLLAGCGETSAGLPVDLQNTGFEQIANGAPALWHIDQKVKGKGTIDITNSSSGNVLRLTPNSQNTGSDLLGAGQMLDASKFAGGTINVSALVGADGGALAIVGVHVLGEGDGFDFIQFKQSDSKGALVHHEAKLNVAANASNIIVYAITNTTSGHAYFDDIVLTGLSDTASKQAQSDAEITATVTIDTSNVIRKVPRSLFGTNIEWINNGQGLWSTQANAVDKQAVEEIKSSSFALFRFPGGVFSDYYNWQEGVGTQRARPAALHYPGGPKSQHVFGTDELIYLSKQTGADLLITVNAGHGTPAMAAEWVDYLNNKKKQNVTFWEVGNELYMDGDLSGAEINAKEYANRYQAFAKAMKAVDPSIKLGAIGGLNYGSYRFIKADNWSKTVLDSVGSNVDFLAVHNAYAPVLMGGGENADPSEVYKAMLAAPLNIEKNIQSLDSLLKNYDKPNKQISVAITEWGPFFHVLPSSKWVDHVKTFGSSLFVGATINTFLRQPRVEIANAFKLTDMGFMGWLGNRNGKFVPTAPMMAFDMYADVIEGNVVESAVAVDSYSSRAIGVIDAVKAVPYLDVVSVEKDGKLIVMVVNKHFTSSVATTLTLEGTAAFTSYDKTEMTADSLDANTGTQLPVIPGLEWASQVNISRFHQGGDSEVSVQHNVIVLPVNSNNGIQTVQLSFAPKSITKLVFKK